jgi:diguanylate cyclase (GGDEF)-like protein
MGIGRVLRRLVNDERPASVWTLALLLLGGGVRCLIGPGLHAVDRGAVVVAAVGAVSVLLAASVYLAGERLPRFAVPTLLIVTVTITSILVASSRDRADVVLNAFAYPWTALYAAHFLSRRSAYMNIAVVALGFWAGITVSGLPHEVGPWVVVVATVAAVTAVTTSLVGALRRQSETDPLTRIANRAGFQRVAVQVLASAARRDQPVSLVLCDIDGLKQINDAGGHAAGDALLTGIVDGWLGVLRGTDVLARLGGDEFVVLLPDTSTEGAQQSVDRLRGSTDRAFSAGVATWTPGDSLESLIADADAAMYACKPRANPVEARIPAPRRPTPAVVPAPNLP